jgi:hypothetical protein
MHDSRRVKLPDRYRDVRRQVKYKTVAQQDLQIGNYISVRLPAQSRD